MNTNTCRLSRYTWTSDFQHRVCRQYQEFCCVFFNMQKLKSIENGFMIYIKTTIGHIILMTLIDWLIRILNEVWLNLLFKAYSWFATRLYADLKNENDILAEYMYKKGRKLRKYLFWKNCLFNEKQNQHHLKSRFTAGNWFTELHCCISYAIYLNENEYNRLQTYQLQYTCNCFAREIDPYLFFSISLVFA